MSGKDRSGVLSTVKTRMESILGNDGEDGDQLPGISEELAVLVKRVEKIRSKHGINVELSPYITTMIKLVGNIEIRDDARKSLAVQL